jgi:hypothetical protein
MLGNLVGPRGCLAGLAILALSCAQSSCAHTVSQEAATGEDGRQKGAKPIPLENGEGHASGIVTYPGGDRVDWKLIELPDKQRGTLDLQLAWAPPRPGLQLAFDVFDEWNQPIVESAKTSKKRSKGRVKTASVDSAKGKYYVRIYAVGRGDAGKYRLNVSFKEGAGGAMSDLSKLDVPDPPKLAAVPEAEVPCDEFAFDAKNPACKAVCPQTGAPPGWPACKDRCPTPPDINVPSCLATMPCPNPPDRRVKSCKFGPCDRANPDPNNPNCDGIKAQAIGRIVAKTIQGSDVIITIGVGSAKKVQPGWTGNVLRGDSDQPLTGGTVEVVRVDNNVTVGKVHLTADQLSANPRVRLSAP